MFYFCYVLVFDIKILMNLFVDLVGRLLQV